MDSQFYIGFGTDSGPFDRRLELVIELHVLKSMMGQSESPIQVADVTVRTTPESPYDIHRGTEFENSQLKIVEDMYPQYRPRTEAYRAIGSRIVWHKRLKVKRDLDKRLPKSRFGNDIPVAVALDLFINTYIPNYGKPQLREYINHPSVVKQT